MSRDYKVFKRAPKKFDLCPVCGKPRRDASYDHGKCMEIRAKTEGKKKVTSVIDPKTGRVWDVTVEQR